MNLFCIVLAYSYLWLRRRYFRSTIKINPHLFCIVLAYSYLCNRKQLIMINMTITERFLNYVKFDTQSSEESTTVPSTSKQLIFAKYLKEELEREGFADVEMDEMGYIYATLKSNTKKEVPTIGFISHYDTSPDCSGADIKPSIVSNYNGSDIELSPGRAVTGYHLIAEEVPRTAAACG